MISALLMTHKTRIRVLAKRLHWISVSPLYNLLVSLNLYLLMQQGYSDGGKAEYGGRKGGKGQQASRTSNVKINEGRSSIPRRAYAQVRFYEVLWELGNIYTFRPFNLNFDQNFDAINGKYVFLIILYYMLRI